MVVEKPTGEFGVNFDATGPVLLVFDQPTMITYPVSSFVTSLAELQHKFSVFDVFVSLVVGGVKVPV